MELTASIHYDDLVERCKKGGSLCFRELYQQYAKPMYNTSLRIVNNTADAEDIVQESFISAFRNIDSFNYESPFGAWIKKIVVNRSINYLRDKKMKLVEITQANAGSLETEEPVEEINTSYKVDEIKKALSMLPDGYRAVFTLSAFEGYDNEEISQILKISESTVRTQYHRAKKQLVLIIKRRRNG